jgi:DNA-directed RNA polymerase subunit RPC12/RpoP
MAHTCQYCGKEYGNAGGLANHVKFNHADEDADPDEGGDLDPVESDEDPADHGGDEGDESARDEAGGDLDPADDPAADEGDDGDESVADDAEALELDDDDDAKDYNCGNCGEPVEYLGGEDARGGGKVCPECGDRLLWSKV